MRSHRKVFIGGLLGVGVLAVWGASLGLPMHALLVGASTVTAGADIWQIYHHEYQHTKGRKARTRLAGKMAWLPLLVAASALGGATVESHHLAGGATTVGASNALSSFATGVVTAGDVPTGAVTTIEDSKD
ncbi:MAG: hypothetical protein JRH20_14420 [Deltaproteobacteria bacterium]|nr:hypothetical protein [Deltaproteobacteria bacterium]